MGGGAVIFRGRVDGCVSGCEFCVLIGGCVLFIATKGGCRVFRSMVKCLCGWG